MKKILIGLMGLMGLVGMVACDKIEPGENGEYTVYGGSVATWTDGTAVADHTHRSIVEKYTGPQCNNCPTADDILNDMHSRVGDRMVVMAINPRSGQGVPYDGNPDMSTDDGEQWVERFGASNLPYGMLDRTTSYEGAPAFNSLEADIEAATADEAAVALDVKATRGDKVTIEVGIEFLQDVDQPLTLTLALTEDSLVYWQISTTGLKKDYAHNHMLRDVITDVWGIDIDATGTKGECRKAQFKYTLPEGVKVEKCHVVAMVSDKASLHVLNSKECTIDE